MPITATCPHCGEQFQVPDSAGGKRFKCRACAKPMDVPSAEEAAAGAEAAEPDEGDEEEDDEEEDDGDDEDAEAESEDDEEEDDDADEESDEDADSDEKPKKKSWKERKAEREAKKKGKDKKGKGKDKDKKKDRKGKDKKDKKKDKSDERKDKKPASAAPAVSLPEADAGAAMSETLSAIQRALHPSRLFTATTGVAAGMFSAVLLGLLLGQMLPLSLWYITAYVPMGVGAVIVIFAMVAVAKVDLAALEGEEPPGPIAALLSAAKGALGSIGAPVLLVVAVGLVGVVMYLVGMSAKIPYLGAILALPLLIGFFVINFALVLGTPLSLWLLIPIAAQRGNDPVGPLLETFGRIKRDPIRITISYILFVMFSTLILGVLMAFGFGAFVASMIEVAQHVGMSVPGMGGGTGGSMGAFGATEAPWYMSTVGKWIVGIFAGAAMSVIVGLLTGPYLAAFVCAGCQEVHSHPYEDDE